MRIKYLENKDKEKFYPVGHTDGVYNNQGKSVTQLFNELSNDNSIITITVPENTTQILTTLQDGLYKIIGRYKISSKDTVTRISSSGILVIKESDDSNYYIKIIRFKDILDFKVLKSTNDFVEDEYAKKSFVNEKTEVATIQDINALF